MLLAEVRSKSWSSSFWQSIEYHHPCQSWEIYLCFRSDKLLLSFQLASSRLDFYLSNIFCIKNPEVTCFLSNDYLRGFIVTENQCFKWYWTMRSESQGDWFNLHWLNMTQYHQSKLQSCSLPVFLCLFRQSITSFQPGTYPELQDNNGRFAISFKWVGNNQICRGSKD